MSHKYDKYDQDVNSYLHNWKKGVLKIGFEWHKEVHKGVTLKRRACDKCGRYHCKHKIDSIQNNLTSYITNAASDYQSKAPVIQRPKTAIKKRPSTTNTFRPNSVWISPFM